MQAGMMPHLMVPEFLCPQDAADLFTWALDHESAFAPSMVDYGRPGGSFRQSLSAPLDKPLRHRLRDGVEKRMPEILAALRMPAFDYQFEIGVVAYKDGGYISRHIDTRGDTSVTGKQPRVDRRISAVYYFHKQPKAFSGGELLLYPLLGGEPEIFEPVHNSLVVFPAFAPHEARPVICPSKAFEDSRFIVNIWLRARNAEALA